MKRLNKKGSVLTMAVIVTLIAMVLIGGMFMVVSIYYQRSFQNNAHRQAYLYAKDTCQVFGMKIAKGEGSDYIPDSDEPKTYNNVKLEVSDDIKPVAKKVTVTRSDHKITIKATSVYQKQKAVVKLQLNATDYENKNDPKDWTWNIGVYS